MSREDNRARIILDKFDKIETLLGSSSKSVL